MKLKTRSPQILTLHELQGLALIGFVLWLAAIGWLPVATANAASGGPRHGDPEKKLARMQTQLNLSAEQVDQVRPILENLEAQRRVLFEKYQGQDRSQMRAEMRQLRAETESALAAVLTEDHLAKWQQSRENRRGQRSKDHPSG